MFLITTLIHGTRTRAVTTNGQMLVTTVEITIATIVDFFITMNHTAHGLSTQAVEVRRQNRGLLLRVLQQ